MKAQTQALTTVLITTVTIAAIAAGYAWGTPLLEKRQSQASLNNVERSTVELYSAIQSVSRSGQGSARTIKISPNEGSIELNEELDYIEVKTVAKSSPYPQDTWKLLRGSSMQNLSVGAGDYALRDQNSLGVIGITSSSGAKKTIRYRVEFRNLLANDRIERIDLKPVGGSASTGGTEIVVRNTGIEVDDNYIAGGTPYDRYRTMVEVDLK